MSSRKPGSLSLDEETWGELEKLALLKGTSKSELAERWINAGMAKEVELTSIERLNHADKAISFKLDSMLLLLNLTSKEGFRRKFTVILNETEALKRHDVLYSRKGTLQSGIFEILREIESYDGALFQELSKELKGQIKQQYLSLYSN